MPKVGAPCPNADAAIEPGCVAPNDGSVEAPNMAGGGAPPLLPPNPLKVGAAAAGAGLVPKAGATPVVVLPKLGCELAAENVAAPEAKGFTPPPPPKEGAAVPNAMGAADAIAPKDGAEAPAPKVGAAANKGKSVRNQSPGSTIKIATPHIWRLV